MAFQTNTATLPPEFAEYALPSGGITYRLKSPNFPKTVKIKSFSFRTEAILVSNLTGDEKMRMIAKSVVDGFPDDFDFDDLLDSDQMVILAVARAQTYGETWSYQTTCSQCGHRESHEMAIPEQLPVRTWKFRSQGEYEKAMSVVLPVCKDSVRLRPITVGDKIDFESVSGTKNEQTGSAEFIPRKRGWDDLPEESVALLREIAIGIDAINGGRPDTVDDAMDYILSLGGKDKTALQKHRSDTKCGIEFSLRVKCDKCSAIYSSHLPIASSFFRGND